MNSAGASPDARVVATLLLAMFAAGACRHDDSVQPPPALSTSAVSLGASTTRAGGDDALPGEVLARLRTLTARFHDIAVADAEEYSVALTGCVADPKLGGMGFHVGKERAIDAKVDPLEPEVLLYEPQANGRRRLVAVEFVVPYEFAPRDGPAPQLFGREFIPIDEFGLWGLHAWIWRHNPSGMFADFNPTVGCDAAPAEAHTSHSSRASSHD